MKSLWVKRFFAYGMGDLEASVYKVPSLVTHHNPDAPFLDTTPESIYEKLYRVLSNPKYGRKLGNDQYRYVKRVHDTPVVAQKLVKGLLEAF